MSTSSGSPAELCTCVNNIDTGSCDTDELAAIASYVAGGCQNEDNGEDVTCGQMVSYLQTMSVDVTECSSNVVAELGGLTEAAWLGGVFAPTCCVDAAHPCVDLDPVAMSGDVGRLHQWLASG